MLMYCCFYFFLQRTHMVAAPLTVTERRAEVVDFSHPFQSIGPVIILKRPKNIKPPLKDSLSKLLVPLEFSVWLMSVLGFFAMGTALYIISYFNPYEWRRMSKDREATLREAESFTCLNSFWFVLSTMAWQGTHLFSIILWMLGCNNLPCVRG